MFEFTSIYSSKYQQVCNIGHGETEASCTTSPAADEPGSECYCVGGLREPRTQSDVYTEFAYMLCNYGSTFYYECQNGYKYNSQFEECSPESPVCHATGQFGFPEDCEYYYICLAGNSIGQVEKCPNGEFFNPNTGHCDPDPDRSVSCINQSGPYTGLLPDDLYCNVYYLCDNGTLTDTEVCPSESIFSPEDNTCVPDDGSCINIGYCFP